jgi:hypothetical protein
MPILCFCLNITKEEFRLLTCSPSRLGAFNKADYWRLNHVQLIICRFRNAAAEIEDFDLLALSVFIVLRSGQPRACGHRFSFSAPCSINIPSLNINHVLQITNIGTNLAYSRRPRPLY